MDATAIKEIGDNAVANAINKYLEERGFGVVALPDEHSINDMEEYAEHRRNYRLEFTTQNVEEFNAYVIDNKDDNTAVFIDKSDMKATAIFDLGDKDAPGHGRHSAVVKLVPTAEFAMVNRCVKNEGCALSQQSFAEWLEDWRDIILAGESEEGPEISIKSVVTAVRKMTVTKSGEAGSSIQSLSQERTAMEKIAVSGADTLPGFIFIKTRPFETFDSATFRFRVSVITNVQPSFKLRPVGYDGKIELIANEFAHKIRARVNGCDVRVGTVKY